MIPLLCNPLPSALDITYACMPCLICDLVLHVRESSKPCDCAARRRAALAPAPPPPLEGQLVQGPARASNLNAVQSEVSSVGNCAARWRPPIAPAI